MFGKKRKIKKQWEDNLGEEQEFWHSLASKTNKSNPEWNDNFHRRAQVVGEFPAEYEAYLAEGQAQIKVLDVGAGPITQLGSKHEWRQIDIVPVDPLADYYNQMLEEYKVNSAHPRTIACEGESLSKMFSKNEFDFVYSRNALDHSYDPVAAIKEIVQVLKPNCYFYLSCFINEGAGGGYLGLHQWNFDLAETADDFIVWNETQRFSLKDRLPKNVVIEAGHGASEEWMYAAIQKQ